MLDAPDMAGRFEAIEPRPATREEIEAVHIGEYIDRVEAADGVSTNFDPDTYTSPKSVDAARLAAGGTIEAIDAVLDGRLDNAFCLHRPPGHHAERDRAMGFCLFNNAAIGAAHAIARGAKRVLVFDPDVHHGNGTQHVFDRRADVLYISTHQYPFYPGTGALTETGIDEGRGFTVNVPLSPGHGDGDFAAIVDAIVVPIGRAYRPDLVIVSAGYDIHENDPLGGMRVTAAGYGRIIERMARLAGEVCGGKIVLVLEGGYDLRGLTDSVKESLIALADGDAEPSAAPDPLMPQHLEHVLDKVRRVQAPFWPQVA